MEQAQAVYNYPYKHDLRVRKQNPDLQPGDYFKSNQAQREGRLDAMRQALTDLGLSLEIQAVCMPTDLRVHTYKCLMSGKL